MDDETWGSTATFRPVIKVCYVMLRDRVGCVYFRSGALQRIERVRPHDLRTVISVRMWLFHLQQWLGAGGSYIVVLYAVVVVKLGSLCRVIYIGNHNTPISRQPRFYSHQRDHTQSYKH